MTIAAFQNTTIANNHKTKIKFMKYKIKCFKILKFQF